MRAGMALAAALAAMAASAPSAGAVASDCPRGCVILIEVDGLEPGDVSAEKTPFLWTLAHPGQVLPNRAGFMWQAGRAPMTTGTAPSAASLITGANPDQHGVVADEFFDPEIIPVSDDDPRTRRLRPERDEGGGAARPIVKLARPGLLEAATEAGDVWAFIGNPAIHTMLEQQELALADRVWSPAAENGSDPSLCAPPRTLPEDTSGADQEAEGTLERDCPARDATTLANAFNALTGQTKTPVVTYVHLAELGRTKQLDGEPEAVETVAALDAELGAFVTGLSRHVNTASGWSRSLVVVTGNHGYEPTPLDQRVPHPTDEGKDFGQYVAEQSTGTPEPARFVGQGTIGTVYWPGAAPEQLTALSGAIEGACDCIDEVLPVATLGQLHSTWHLNPLTADGVPTGTGGELVVTLDPGWAFGRATPGEGGEVTNPHLASSGGPRNRAIAVLMNGPRTDVPHPVRQIEDRMEVKPSAETPPDCSHDAGVADDVANAPDTMADDAAAVGHECQPETVDIAFSLAAMLQVKLEAAPHARFLNEAFAQPLGVEEEAPVVDEEVREEPPPPDPPPVVIRTGSVQVIPPPPFVDPFPYRGLVRRIRVRVSDAGGRGYRQAKRGALMSSIEVRADFGRPQSLVTLTFYRRAKGARALKALARFKPFVVKRGPVRLKLKIPRQFRPTHLGLSVQEVEGEGRVKRPVGDAGGGIAAIADAARLHTIKRAVRRRGR